MTVILERKCQIRDQQFESSAFRKRTKNFLSSRVKHRFRSMRISRFVFVFKSSLFLHRKFDKSFSFKIKVQLAEKNFDRSSCRNFSRKSQIYTSFIESYRKLTTEELRDGLCIPISQIKDTVLHNVPCIGCRSRFRSSVRSTNEFAT